MSLLSLLWLGIGLVVLGAALMVGASIGSSPRRACAHEAWRMPTFPGFPRRCAHCGQPEAVTA